MHIHEISNDILGRFNRKLTIRVLKQVSALKTRRVSLDVLCTVLKNNQSIKEHVENVHYCSNLYDLRSFLENSHTKWDIVHFL